MNNKDNRDLMNVDSIVKNITTIGGIQLQHRISVYKQNTKNGGRNTEYETTYRSRMSKGGLNGCDSYQIRETKDYIIFSETFDYNGCEIKEDVKRKRNSVLFTYSDVENIRILLDKASAWFIEDRYRNDLFQYDKNGIPYAVSGKYENLFVMTNLSVGRGNFLAIQPVVVLDALNSIGYPGVIFKSSNGRIGTCTMSEYFALVRVTMTLLDNLYTNSLNLLNHYLLNKKGEDQNYAIY